MRPRRCAYPGCARRGSRFIAGGWGGVIGGRYCREHADLYAALGEDEAAGTDGVGDDADPDDEDDLS